MRVNLQPQHGSSGELAMAGGDGDLRYDIPAHKTTNGRHGKVKKLTVNRLERSASSGEASMPWFDGGGDGWRERRMRVRVNSINM